MTPESPPDEAPSGLDAPLPRPLAFLAGLLMGGADSVPGVSGGTIALIVGVYDRLVAALSRLTRLPRLVRTTEGRLQLRRTFGFLMPLGIGLVLAYFLGTLILVGPDKSPGLIRDPASAPFCFAFFFGLVLVSLREPWRRIPRAGVPHYTAALVAAVGAALFAGLPHVQGEPSTLALFYGGALAIAVMLLPGVSGSLMLVVLGQYTTVASALHDRTAENLVVLGVFLAGVTIGLITFVPCLRYLLRRHHDLTMAALAGLMLGSLRALWPWKRNYDPTDGPLTNLDIGDPVVSTTLVGAAAMVVLGGLAAWALARLERKMTSAS